MDALQEQLDDLIDRSRAPLQRERESAVRSLARVGYRADPRVLPTLVRALDDREHEIRRAAALALGRIAQRHPAPELRLAIAPLRRQLARWSLDSRDYDYGYRWVLLSALHRIEAATNGVKDVPLPAAGPEHASHQLPMTHQSGVWPEVSSSGRR